MAKLSKTSKITYVIIFSPKTFPPPQACSAIGYKKLKKILKKDEEEESQDKTILKKKFISQYVMFTVVTLLNFINIFFGKQDI